VKELDIVVSTFIAILIALAIGVAGAIAGVWETTVAMGILIVWLLIHHRQKERATGL
jgi:hypothetical protein